MSAAQVTEQIRAIPRLIEQSLSALSNPRIATQETHRAAVANLEKYEAALELPSQSSARFNDRIAAVMDAAERIACEALPPVSRQKENLTDAHLEEAISQLTSVNEKLTWLVTILNDDALAALRQTSMHGESSASRETPHDAVVSQQIYLFSVAPCDGTIVDELTTRLGDRAASQLVETWRNRDLLALMLEKETEIAVFSDSNSMARNEYYDEPGERVTQEEYLKSAGYTFASEAAAIALCARLVEKASKLGVNLKGEPVDWLHSEADKLSQLSEADAALLTRLKLGVMRTRSGALGIDASGHLRAFSYFPEGASTNAWAFGEKL